MLEVEEDPWLTYKVPEEGFSLKLPRKWGQRDLDKQQIKQGVKFVAMDESTINTGFATNVNVMREQNPMKATDLDVVVAFTWKEMSNYPIKGEVVHKRLNLAAGDCERYHFQMTVNIPQTGKSALGSFTSFNFVKGTYSYVVTLTTLPENEEYYAPIFERIGQSFQWEK